MSAPLKLTFQLNYLNKKVIRNRLKIKENKKPALKRGFFRIIIQSEAKIAHK